MRTSTRIIAGVMLGFAILSLGGLGVWATVHFVWPWIVAHSAWLCIGGFAILMLIGLVAKAASTEGNKSIVINIRQ